MEQYQENSRRTRRVAAAQVVLAELTKPAEVIPVVLERTDVAQQEFLHVTDRGHGWTSEGEYI